MVGMAEAAQAASGLVSSAVNGVFNLLGLEEQGKQAKVQAGANQRLSEEETKRTGIAADSNNRISDNQTRLGQQQSTDNRDVAFNTNAANVFMNTDNNKTQLKLQTNTFDQTNFVESTLWSRNMFMMGRADAEKSEQKSQNNLQFLTNMNNQRTQAPPPQKSNTALYVGGGFGFILIITIIIVLIAKRR